MSNLSTPTPANTTMDHTATGLELAYRWYTHKFVFFALFLERLPCVLVLDGTQC